MNKIINNSTIQIKSFKLILKNNHICLNEVLEEIQSYVINYGMESGHLYVNFYFPYNKENNLEEINTVLNIINKNLRKEEFYITNVETILLANINIESILYFKKMNRLLFSLIGNIIGAKEIIDNSYQEMINLELDKENYFNLYYGNNVSEYISCPNFGKEYNIYNYCFLIGIRDKIDIKNDHISYPLKTFQIIRTLNTYLEVTLKDMMNKLNENIIDIYNIEYKDNIEKENYLLLIRDKIYIEEQYKELCKELNIKEDKEYILLFKREDIKGYIEEIYNAIYEKEYI